MKQGRTISELATEIERQARSKRDLVADTRQITVRADGRSLLLDGHGDFELRDLALAQIGSHTGVPVPYLRKMQSDAPRLLADNVNHWLHERPTTRMVRTLDGAARAFLSNRYQRTDNLEAAETVLPVLAEVGQREGGLEVVSTEVTEHRLYLKAVFPQIRGEVRSRRVGDVVEAGVLISNSEVGLGAVSVKAFVRLLACLNGMTRDGGNRWNHVGRRLDETDAIYELMTDETRAADDRALLLKVRDTVAATVDRGRFETWLATMQESTTQRLEGDVPAAVEVLGRRVGLGRDERSTVLRHLIEGGDLSRWGLANAVTRTAEDLGSYDRATELEAIGGALLELPRSEWREIATAEPPRAAA